MAIRSPAHATLGIPNPNLQGGPEIVSVTASTELKAATKAYPAALGPRQRLIVRPLDGDIWASRVSPVTVTAGLKILSGELMEFAGSAPVYAIADAGTVAVNVYELGEEDDSE